MSLQRRFFLLAAAAAVLAGCASAPAPVAPEVRQTLAPTGTLREAGTAYLKAFVADAGTQALVQQAAQRAGLRGLAAAETR